MTRRLILVAAALAFASCARQPALERPGSVMETVGISTPTAVGCRALRVAQAALPAPELRRLASTCNAARWL